MQPSRVAIALMLAACWRDADRPAIVLGAPAVPFGLAAHLAPGMSLADARKLAPALALDELSGELVERDAAASYEVRLAHDRIDAIAIRLPTPTAYADVVAAWGPGTAAIAADVASRARPTRFYANATRTVQGAITSVGGDAASVSFVAMRTIASVLGDTPAPELVGVAVLAQPAVTVDAALRAVGVEVAVHAASSMHNVRLPTTEFAAPLRLKYSVGADGVVDQLVVEARDGLPGFGDAVLRAFEHKWGAPSAAAPDGTATYAVAAHHATLVTTPTAVTLTIDR